MTHIRDELLEVKKIISRITRATDDAWLEWLHPRNNKGEFTESGGGRSGAFRPANKEKRSGLSSGVFPVLNVPELKIAKLKEEAFQRAVKGKGPKPQVRAVRMSELASVQEALDVSKVKAIAKKYKSEAELGSMKDLPRVFKYENKYVLVDGNHRAAAALKNGHSKLDVSYLGDFTDL